MWVWRSAATFVVAFLSISASAQRPDSASALGRTGQPAQQVFSMGQPRVWQPHVAAFGLVAGSTKAGGALLGIHRSILNPVTGLLGVTGESYLMASGSEILGSDAVALGLRAMATSRFFGLSAGLDVEPQVARVDFVLSFQTAVRRGGLLGHGTVVRADWLPTRRQAFALGIQAPLGQSFAGRTRPRKTTLLLPNGSAVEGPSAPLPADAELALATISEAATLIRAYTNLYSEESQRTLITSIQAYATPAPTRRLRYGHAYAEVVRSYDEALVQAFSAATADSVIASVIAARARAGLLNDVILPFNALFGQVKKNGGSIRGLTAASVEHFARWLRDSSGLSPAAQGTVRRVHARWLGVVERLHDELRDSWKDTRIVWLPLQLALTPDQHDEQEEVNALVERIVGRPFTDRNALTYLHSSDLPLEIARSLYAARIYHVLWTHDFRGLKENGEVDNIGYSMVADGYLPVLTEAVKRYDSTGTLPAYMIFLDQHWYEVRKGRLWMTVLEDPLNASMRLKGASATQEAHLRERQRELREAVAASVRLQREARTRGGTGWLRSVVKVHVSITQPSDFSFRSHRIVPPIPFTPDNIVRDHRKIAFYDLDEQDPYRGAALLMGVGIGEHYASATWEDRGYRLRGPAALEVRAAARRLLRANGVGENDIPPALRPVASSAAAEQRMDLQDYVGRALQVHNEVGFGQKQASVVRALLYNLAPPGSAIIVPDPLWLSESWAAMLAGAAARGARVMIVAPAKANAPSPEASVMAREHDVMRRLLYIRATLRAQLERAGGEIRIGLYAARSPVDDIAGRRRELREGLDRAPWIRQLIPFDSQTVAVLSRTETQTAGGGEDATGLAHDDRARAPQLHQKTQLIARPGAIESLVRQRGWEEVLTQAMQVQSRQTAQVFDELSRAAPRVADDAIRRTDALLRGYELALPEADRKRVSFYFSLGSLNEDLRGEALDGEATMVVSGFHAAAGLVDLYFLMARSTWIENEAELDRLVPPPKSLMRRLGRLIRFAV